MQGYNLQFSLDKGQMFINMFSLISVYVRLTRDTLPWENNIQITPKDLTQYVYLVINEMGWI